MNSLRVADVYQWGPSTSLRISGAIAVLLAHGCLLPSVEPADNDGSAAIPGSSRTQVDVGRSAAAPETAQVGSPSGGSVPDPGADFSTDTANQMGPASSSAASAMDVCANSVCTADYPCQQRDASYTCRGQFIDWVPASNSVSFVDNHDGTVTDSRSGLSWQQDINVSYAPTCTVRYANASTAEDACTWEQALSFCASLKLAGGGWRLPTRAELETIVDFGRRGPSINIGFFPDTLSQPFWSSSPTVSSTANAWFLDFTSGSGNHKAKNSLMRVRCVR